MVGKSVSPELQERKEWEKAVEYYCKIKNLSDEETYIVFESEKFVGMSPEEINKIIFQEINKKILDLTERSDEISGLLDNPGNLDDNTYAELNSEANRIYFKIRDLRKMLN